MYLACTPQAGIDGTFITMGMICNNLLMVVWDISEHCFSNSLNACVIRLDASQVDDAGNSTEWRVSISCPLLLPVCVQGLFSSYRCRWEPPKCVSCVHLTSHPQWPKTDVLQTFTRSRHSSAWNLAQASCIREEKPDSLQKPAKLPNTVCADCLSQLCSDLVPAAALLAWLFYCPPAPPTRHAAPTSGFKLLWFSAQLASLFVSFRFRCNVTTTHSLPLSQWHILPYFPHCTGVTLCNSFFCWFVSICLSLLPQLKYGFRGIGSFALAAACPQWLCQWQLHEWLGC